jgi:uncharacterized iron-regulated protein
MVVARTLKELAGQLPVASPRPVFSVRSARRQMNKTFRLLPALVLLAGCASAPAPWPPAPAPSRSVIFLLGEVHDNPASHARRFDLIKAKLEAGWRPAIVMEQFDRERQADLDRAVATCPNADCVIAAAAGTHWEWPLYKPVIALALDYKLKLVAANLARADASKVMRDGFAAVLDAGTIADYALDQPLPAALVDAQTQAIREGHCNKLPESMVGAMVRAQVARDVVMAQALTAHAAYGAILLAGNGHVRLDAGVPHWLKRHGNARVVSIGYVESAAYGPYDQSIRVKPHPRPDPCARR